MAKRKTSAKPKPSQFRAWAYPREGTMAPVVMDNLQNLVTNDPFVWYGEDNLYPEWVRLLLDNCGIMERCAQTLAKFIAGNGIKFYDKEGEEIEGMQEKFQKLLNNTTEEDFLYQTAYDIAHGLGMCWTIRKSATQIVRIDHLDVLGFRSGYMNLDKDADGLPVMRPKSAFWCSNWPLHMRNKTDERFLPVEIPRYYHDGKDHPMSLLYDRVYKPRQPYYSEPWFMGCMRAAEVWSKVDEFNRTQIDTGFTPKIVLGTRKEGTEAELDKHDQRVEAAYTGSQGRALFHFTMGEGELEPFFKELKMGNHAGQLDEIRNGSADVVCEVFGVPAILLRERKEGLTSQSKTISERLQQFQRIDVEPWQKLITRNLVPLMDDERIWQAVIEPLNIYDPVQSDAVILASTTVNEARRQRGDDDLKEEEGEMLMIKVKADPAPAEDTPNNGVEQR
jgi:hypothetical protein